MKTSAIVRLVATVVFAHFLLCVAMAASPQFHEFFHCDSGNADHHCAVTDMLAGGSGDGTFMQPLNVDAILPRQFYSVAAFHPAWVALLFLSHCVLEHAPPAVS